MDEDMSQIQTTATRTGDSAIRITARKTATKLAVDDLIEGLARWRLWTLMGWQDIKQRYRRSTLGPFWLTISMAILVGTLGILYGQLFRMEIDEYLPFLTLGFLSWGLISGVIGDGCAALIAAEGMIKGMRLPFSIHVYRVVWRNLIMFAHNIVVYVAVMVIFQIWPGATALLVLPGLALIVLNSVWVGLLFAMVCARFRDVPQIVTSLLQVAFFLTPIIWKPELLGRHHRFVDLNPFYHFVELVRAPLLGHSPGLVTWAVALGTSAAGWMVTIWFFQRFQGRLAYWV